MRIALFLFLLPCAFATTGAEVLEKMGTKEQAAYISGAVDMAAQAGDDTRAACISDWYYRSNGEAQRQIAAAFKQYGDKSAVGIIGVLIRKRCETATTK